MRFDEYQKLAMRSARNSNRLEEQLINGGLGIAGEAGEVADHIKKITFHQHPLNGHKLMEEIGDVLWYCALIASALGQSLGDAAQQNIEKLQKRYPEGFDTERSINREE